MEKEKYKKSRTKLKAEWIIDLYTRECSNCGCCFCETDDTGDYIPSNFCSNCGAKMSE